MAGLLLLVFKDPEVVLKAMLTIVDRFDLGALFNKELPKLKTFFYQMDRLVGLVDEELQAHFKEEGLSTTLFASAWFITLFSSALKTNTEGEFVNESLLQLWDYFLCCGWRAIIKMGVYIMTSHGEKFKQMPFEDILPTINDCAKNVLV
jgi:L-lactate permease